MWTKFRVPLEGDDDDGDGDDDGGDNDNYDVVGDDSDDNSGDGCGGYDVYGDDSDDDDGGGGGYSGCSPWKVASKFSNPKPTFAIRIDFYDFGQPT